MNYIHEYIDLLSSKIINLIQNYNKDLEEIRKYENKLIESLSLIINFFENDLYRENFKYEMVILTDNLQQLLIYTDNFELINFIILCLTFKYKDLFYNLEFSHRLKYQTTRVNSFLANFHLDCTNNYYEFLLQDDKFLNLAKEFDNYLNYDLRKEPFFENIDHLKVTLKLKKATGGFEEKEIEKQNFSSNYGKDNEKPSFMIIQEIIKNENQLENLYENNFESFMKLLYTIKYLKLKNQSQKCLHHLINCLSFNEFAICNWRNHHLVFLISPLLCLHDSKMLKLLLLSFEHAPISKLNTVDKLEFYIHFSRKIVEIMKEIERIYKNNFEIISLAFEQLIFSCFLFYNKTDFENSDQYYEHLLLYLDEFFKQYFIKDENFQKDPLSLLCNPHLSRMISLIFRIFANNKSIQKILIYFEEVNKIIMKIFESIIFTYDNYNDLLKKYPEILYLENIYPHLQTILLDERNSKNDCFVKIFSEIPQKILQKIQNFNDSRSLDFYRFFIENFAKFLMNSFLENSFFIEKQAFYDIIEELCLKRNHLLHADLEKLYRILILEDIILYPDLLELMKNPVVLKNFKNFIRIHIHSKMIFSSKEPYIEEDITPLIPFNSLVMNEVIDYMKWLFEKSVKPHLNNLKEFMKNMSTSDKKREFIDKIYLVFMLFKTRKIKRGFMKVLNYFKEIKNELSEEQFRTFFECLTEIFSNPLLVGIHEKTKRFDFNFNFNTFKVIDKNRNDVSIENTFEHLKNILVPHFERFSLSFKRLIENSTQKEVLLLDFFSNARQINYSYHYKKKDWDYITEFLVDAYKKINYSEIFFDLQNVSKMKFYFLLLKSEKPQIENEKLGEVYYRCCELMFEIFPEIISIFSKDHPKSQFQEFKMVFIQKQIYGIEIYSWQNMIYNAVYERIKTESDFTYKSLLKTYKIIKRFFNFPRKVYSFKNNCLSEAISIRFDELFIKFWNKNLEKYNNFNPRNFDCREVNEVFIQNLLFYNYIQNIFSNEIYTIFFNTNFLKNLYSFNLQLSEFFQIKEININVLNFIKHGEITEEYFFKIILMHIYLIDFKFHKNIFQNLNKILKKGILSDRIDENLTSYKLYMKLLNKKAVFLEDRSDFLLFILKFLNEENSENLKLDKNCQINTYKANLVILEEMIFNIANIKLIPSIWNGERDSGNGERLFELIRPIFETFCQTNIQLLSEFLVLLKKAIEELHENEARKAILVKLLDSVLKFFEESLRTSILEMCSQNLRLEDNKKYIKYFETVSMNCKLDPQNIIFIILFFEKLILSNDLNEEFQKLNIEIKIKEIFYDEFLTQSKSSINVEEFKTNKEIIDQCILNKTIFYKVLNILCIPSQDNKIINLRSKITLDRFNTIENNKVNKEIASVVYFLLELIINSIGITFKYYTDLVQNASQTDLNSPLAGNHALYIEVLRVLINRFPAIILHIIDFKVSKEIIEKYFKSVDTLYVALNEKQELNTDDYLSFIDFIWIISPYNMPIAQVIFGILIETNYLFKICEIRQGENCLLSSSIQWKYELLGRGVTAIQRILDRNKIFTDLNIFIEFHHLILIILNLIDKFKMLYKELWRIDEELNISLLQNLLNFMKNHNDSKYLPFVNLNMAFFSLFRKIHNRLIKIAVVSRKKTKYEKNDFKFYKFYIQKNISEILSRNIIQKKFVQKPDFPIHSIISGFASIYHTKDYLSNISYKYQADSNAFIFLLESITSSSSKIYDYYEFLRNQYPIYIYSKAYKKSATTVREAWIEEFKNNTIIFGEKYSSFPNYNQGITQQFFSFFNLIANFESYPNVDDVSIYEKIYKLAEKKKEAENTNFYEKSLQGNQNEEILLSEENFLKNKFKVLSILENAALIKLSKGEGSNLRHCISEEEWSKLYFSINQLDEETKDKLLKTIPHEIINDFPAKLRDVAQKKRHGYLDTVASIKNAYLKKSNGNLSDYSSKLEESDPLRKDNENNFSIDSETFKDLSHIFDDSKFFEILPDFEEDVFIFIINCINSVEQLSFDSYELMKFINSLIYIPKNAYKLIDFFIFVLSFKDENNSIEEINSKLGNNNFFTKMYNLNGEMQAIFFSDMRKKVLNILSFICEKKLALPLLVNAYTLGCDNLIYEDKIYAGFSFLKIFREIMSFKEEKKEIVWEKLLRNHSYFANFAFQDILSFKKDNELDNMFLNNFKVVCHFPKSTMHDFYLNTINLNDMEMYYSRIEANVGYDIEILMNLIIKNLHQEFEKYNTWNSKKEKILEFKVRNNLSQDICSIKDLDIRQTYSEAINLISNEDEEELRNLRRAFKNVLKKLQDSIKKFVKNEIKDKKIKTTEMTELTEIPKKQPQNSPFNQVVKNVCNKFLESLIKFQKSKKEKKLKAKFRKNNSESVKKASENLYPQRIQEIINQFNRKIHQDNLILLFFQNFFEFSHVLLDAVGIDSSNHIMSGIKAHRSTFKLFIDLYIFLNPFGEIDYNKYKPLENKAASQDEEKKKESEIQNNKASFSKSDFDVSLQNSFSKTYGKLVSLVEIFMKHNSDRISKIYYYYLKYAPIPNDIRLTNLKFIYLRFYNQNYKLILLK